MKNLILVISIVTAFFQGYNAGKVTSTKWVEEQNEKARIVMKQYVKAEALVAELTEELVVEKTVNSLKHRERFSKETGVKLIDISDSLGVNPDWISEVIHKESLWNPEAVNLQGDRISAAGLIQFVPSTAKQLGTSVAEIVNSPATEQLDIVYRYLKPVKAHLNNEFNVHAHVFFGSPFGRTFQEGTIYYDRNRTMDVNSDGFITPLDFKIKRGLM